MESGPRQDQDAPVRLLLFQAEDLLCCKHWSREEDGASRGEALWWPPAWGLAPHPCPHASTLTQEQVEDPGGHPARADGGHQAAEVGLPVGLQLLGHCPVGGGRGQPEPQPAPTPPRWPYPGTCTQPPATAARAPGAAPGAAPGPRAPQAAQGAPAARPQPRP